MSFSVSNDGDYRLLRLDGQGLEALPPNLEQQQKFSSISGIDLARNKFQEFPSEITKFPNIKAIFLTGNRISQLPQELEKMSQLELLALGSNTLRELPPFLFKLKKLTLLDISNNPIRIIPPEIKELTRLSILRTMGIGQPDQGKQPLTLKDLCIDKMLRDPQLNATLVIPDLEEAKKQQRETCWQCRGAFSRKTAIIKRTPLEISGKKLGDVWAAFCSENCSQACQEDTTTNSDAANLAAKSVYLTPGLVEGQTA